MGFAFKSPGGKKKKKKGAVKKEEEQHMLVTVRADYYSSSLNYFLYFTYMRNLPREIIFRRSFKSYRKEIIMT